MSAKLSVLEILQGSDNPCADSVLTEGLARAEPCYHQRLVEVLLARESKAGLLGLVGNFHALDAKLQHLVLEHAELLFGVLRHCVKAREQQARQNAIELVGRAGNYRQAYLLSLALHDAAADNRHRAAELLRELADRYLRQERVTLEVLAGEGPAGPEQASIQAFSLARLAEERSYLISAIGEAVDSYEVHHRAEVAEAVVLFAAHLNEAIWRTITSRLSSCRRAVLDLICASKDPRVVPFVYEALSHRELRPSVVRMISAQVNRAFMAEFVKESFLIADPRIRQGVAAIRGLNWLGRGGQAILELDPELHLRAVELVLATTMAVERKVAICRDLLLSPQQQARRAGLWGLVAIEDDMSTQIIRTVVRWEDQALAAIALREMMRRCPQDLPSVLAEQVASDSPAVREMASEQRSGYGFDQYWHSFDMLAEDDRYHLGQALLDAGQDLLPRLRGELVSSKSGDRLRAVQIVNVLGLAGELEEDIYRIAYDADAFVRSAVMTLLEQLPGPTSERILLNGLNDPDDRVQANSIETLEHLRADNRFKLIRQHLRSEDNRVRANAVKALLASQSPEAGAILLEMLACDQPAHRLSALWVIEGLKLMTLSARVLKLAKHDPDPAVRRRALQAVSVLTGALQGEPAEDPSPATPTQEVRS